MDTWTGLVDIRLEFSNLKKDLEKFEDGSLSMASELREGLQKGDFELYYRPQEINWEAFVKQNCHLGVEECSKILENLDGANPNVIVEIKSNNKDQFQFELKELGNVQLSTDYKRLFKKPDNITVISIKS